MIAGQTVKVKQTATLIERQCLLLSNKIELKMLALPTTTLFTWTQPFFNC